jgi:hypothetical protein
MLLSRRGILYAGTCLGLMPARAWAGDKFWVEKDPGQWSDGERNELLTRSPWAKQVTAQFSMQDRPGGMRTSAPDAGMGVPGGRRGGAGMGPGGGMGEAGGGPGGGGGRGGPMGMSEVTVLVRWESATPIRDAARRGGTADFLGRYVISFSGFPRMGGSRGTGDLRQGGSRPGGEEPDADRTEERARRMESRTKEVTFIERKGHDPIHSDKVESSAERGVLLAFFPREGNLIQVIDKEVTVTTQFGPMTVKAKFSLKAMLYKGELSL